VRAQKRNHRSLHYAGLRRKTYPGRVHRTADPLYLKRGDIFKRMSLGEGGWPSALAAVSVSRDPSGYSRS
jgi:hypothetical protein